MKINSVGLEDKVCIESEDGAKTVIAGGTYTEDVSKYCALGYHCLESAGVYVVNPHGVLEKTEAAEPTVEAAGNKEYWTCLGCGHYFADESGLNEIEKILDT
ncbi:MAG: hypothetical protein IKU67_00475 [Firmicutes bacterium]|nr:hypothetical protein [Bacillota bacterium]